jgi:two-component system, OmpR family, phosphate regulon sensor histidine kinase PhoR
MAMSDATRPGRQQRAILLFLLMVLLPSIVFVVLIVRAVRNDRSHAADRNAQRQREIVRLVESDLNSWLFSPKRPQSAWSDALFRFRREGDTIVFPEYGLSLPATGSPPRPPDPTPPQETPTADVITAFYYPRILVFLRDFKTGAQYFLRLKTMVVLMPNEREGYALDAQRILRHVNQRLAEFCGGESFRASLSIGNTRDEPLPATTGAFALEGFSFFQVVFSDAGTGAAGYRDHLFAYSMSLVVLVAILGSALVYRGVFQESRLSQLRTDFVSAVSHEFRSPLSAILALSERLEGARLRDAEQHAEYYRLIRQEAGRLSMLVTRLLDFAQIEGGKRRYALQRVDLTTLARDACQACRTNGGPDRIRFEEDGGHRWVQADSTAVQTCLQNLIENALKYSPAESAVTVRCRSENGRHAVEVHDLGIGIPREEQARVFDKFYRGRHASALDVQGVGIGLALVKHVAESHGGSVAVESTVGSGSRFSFALPRGVV